MKYANHIMYTDIEPFEVIRQISETCVEIRAMKSTELHDFAELGFQAGGFLGHCSAQHKQRWDIQSDPNGYVTRIRLSKAKGKAGRWFDAHGNRYALSDTPQRVYDYNF